MSLIGQWLGSDTDSSVVEVDVATAYRLQQQGAQLIDVREPNEFKAGHAKGARNIPLADLSKHASDIPLSKTVLLICRDGKSSRLAQALLRRHNRTKTGNVRGGTRAWDAAGLPMR